MCVVHGGQGRVKAELLVSAQSSPESWFSLATFKGWIKSLIFLYFTVPKDIREVSAAIAVGGRGQVEEGGI